MYRVFLTTIVIILILTTSVLGFIKPQMHKKVLIYSSEYKVAENTKPVIIEKKETPTIKQVQAKTEKVENSQPKKQETKKSQNTAKTVIQKKTETFDKKKSTQTTQTPKTEQSNKAKETTKNTIEKVPYITKEITKPIQTIEQEETILWNKWRSDLQNQLMKDTKMPTIEEGTIFKFSFDVDKYGKITNIKTWSTNSIYTPYAIQYIAPVIKSYQGRDILNFPQGSNRYETTVEGSWKISKTLKYSSPNDFKDTEIIKK